MTAREIAAQNVASAEFLLARAQTHAHNPTNMFGEPVSDEMVQRLQANIVTRERELAEARQRLADLS